MDEEVRTCDHSRLCLDQLISLTDLRSRRPVSVHTANPTRLVYQSAPFKSLAEPLDKCPAVGTQSILRTSLVMSRQPSFRCLKRLQRAYIPLYFNNSGTKLLQNLAAS